MVSKITYGQFGEVEESFSLGVVPAIMQGWPLEPLLKSFLVRIVLLFLEVLICTLFVSGTTNHCWSFLSVLVKAFWMLEQRASDAISVLDCSTLCQSVVERSFSFSLQRGF